MLRLSSPARAAPSASRGVLILSRRGQLRLARPPPPRPSPPAPPRSDRLVELPRCRRRRSWGPTSTLLPFLRRGVPRGCASTLAISAWSAASLDWLSSWRSCRVVLRGGEMSQGVDANGVAARSRSPRRPRERPTLREEAKRWWSPGARRAGGGAGPRVCRPRSCSSRPRLSRRSRLERPDASGAGRSRRTGDEGAVAPVPAGLEPVAALGRRRRGPHPRTGWARGAPSRVAAARRVPDCSRWPPSP